MNYIKIDISGHVQEIIPEYVDIFPNVPISQRYPAEFIKNAKAAGCDLYITGDVKYHAAQEAREYNIAVLDCGHFATEQIFCENIISMLDKIDGVDIIQCDVNLNPFAVI